MRAPSCLMSWSTANISPWGFVSVVENLILRFFHLCIVICDDVLVFLCLNALKRRRADLAFDTFSWSIVILMLCVSMTRCGPTAHERHLNHFSWQ